jgi:hypothetical protein
MIGMYVIVASVLVAAGMALGIVVIVSVGVRREKKAGRSLAVSGPEPLANGVRAITALHVRRPEVPYRTSAL